MRKSIIGIALAAGTLVGTLTAQSQVDQVWKKAEDAAKSGNSSTRGLSTDKIAAGLKEALRISTGNAVASTGKPDGFLKNDAIKILLPEKLKTVSRAMHLMGKGAEMDELEVGMNRAAEQAAPEAKEIFIHALTKMTFEDARKILSGDDTAATEYFKKQSSGELTTAFTPIVHRSMENVGVVRQYDQVVQASGAESLLGGDPLNLDKYVVEKSLDGLFYMLGQEEKKIRKDPVAQTTNLLKEVFGQKL
jgi:hypothetical protein